MEAVFFFGHKFLDKIILPFFENFMDNFSGVVEFLSKGAISREHPDLKEFRQDPCITRFSASDDPTVYTHGLRLDCAVDPNSMPFTNYTLVLNLKTCIQSSRSFLKNYLLFLIQKTVATRKKSK